MLGLSGVWFLIITTNIVPRTLVSFLEEKYPQLSDSIIRSLPDSCFIIVLGGGHSDDKNLSPNNQLSTNALGRLVEAIRIHKLLPGSTLILSGYAGESELSQAQVLFNTSLILGIDPRSMCLSSSASNTKMEAEEYLRIFGKGKRLVLVTSAIHMPRAMLIFNYYELEPVPAPVNHLIKHGSRRNPFRWIPSSASMSLMESAVHEYAGILAFKVEKKFSK